MWPLITASYIKQFNENSPSIPQDIIGREKRDVVIILTATYIKRFSENLQSIKQSHDRREMWWLLIALYKTI